MIDNVLSRRAIVEVACSARVLDGSIASSEVLTVNYLWTICAFPNAVREFYRFILYSRSPNAVQREIIALTARELVKIR
jgi:hypothetical protein